MNVYEDRQRAKFEIEAYREAARALYAHATVSHHAHVHRMEDGAFVELTVWVPKSEIEPSVESESVHE